jgi:hypothetical protein
MRARIVRLAGLAAGACALFAGVNARACDFNDSHFHLTNYIQEGPPAADVLKLMRDRVCRTTLFGIPLQQQWSHAISGEIAPTYYLESDAPLYYYSFTDAWIAAQYRALRPDLQARLDPMITGFNPADMYAADHVRRVLTTFPGVFEGIGEFSIHKEFVSSKIAGGPASLIDPALDRLLDFAGEAGLVVLIHNDIVMPFTKAEKAGPYVQQMHDLFARHPKTTFIWAHMGLGRVVQPIRAQASASPERPPVKGQAAYLEDMLSDPGLANVNFDLSWDEVAKYLVADEATTTVAANLINRYPDRFLFGTDTVAPRSPEAYFSVYEMYRPLWTKLTPQTREKVLKTNYLRLFDAARSRVRAWEAANVR